jgi:hypothetical protein
MSNNRYLEIDSTYRNRDLWPDPGEFEIPISMSGNKTKDFAINPTSTAVPIKLWTSNKLAVQGGNLDPATFTVTSVNIGNAGSPTVIMARTPNTPPNTGHELQRLPNYYMALMLEHVDNPITTILEKRRIISYNYLYTNANFDYGEFIVESAFPDSLVPGERLRIRDPTDVSDPSNPYFFIPAGRVQSNAYTNFILYNLNRKQWRYIKNYDGLTHLLSVDTTPIASGGLGPVTGWLTTDAYAIRIQPSLEPIPTTTSVVAAGSTTTVVNLTVTFTITNELLSSLKNSSIRIIPNSATVGVPGTGAYQYVYTNTINNQLLNPQIYSDNRIIISATSSGAGQLTLIVDKPFSSVPVTNDIAELMSYSYDSFNPFSYTGSLVSQQEMVCYEVELVNLILPNETLAVGEGGRIAFYPYVYVELSNVSAPGGHLKDIIYSNNPNASFALFRCPIYDIQNPVVSTFVRIDGDGMVQTIKFKPNDNLYFRVFLQNGQTYRTVVVDPSPPSPPILKSQITALFSIRRL